ncbi:MAG: hypothetical protein R3C52_12780 [Hyphomonadaceae bacterium]
MNTTIRMLGVGVFALASMGLAAGCQGIPDDQTVMQYCSIDSNAKKDICKVNIEVDGVKTALADTNMKLSEARVIADNAAGAAARAQQTADAALAREDDVYCETRTLNRTNVGNCSPGYKVMSCTQTRYTTRAGGPSIMREIDDSHCRFNDKVLEIQVRCCMAGSQARPLEAVVQPEPVAPTPSPNT